MIFDLQQPTMLEGMMVFPEWCFANLPVQSKNIKEQVQIPATPTMQGPKGINLQSSVGSSIVAGKPIFFPGT